ncbi:MAG: nucleotidyltransferase domain-containing protein [Chlamydiota bacterium]
MLGYSAGSIRRELLRFQREGLFQTRREGNLLYYELNCTHHLFPELKSIVSKTIGVEGAIRKALQALPGVSAAFIYGSFASGGENSGSDIDLMIIGDPDGPEVHARMGSLERALRREINVTIYSEQEYRQKKRSHRGFITDLLNKPRILVAGGEDAL